LDVIKNVLKEDKAKYKAKKNEKEIRFEKSKLLEEGNKPKEIEPEPEPQ